MPLGKTKILQDLRTAIKDLNFARFKELTAKDIGIVKELNLNYTFIFRSTFFREEMSEIEFVAACSFYDNDRAKQSEAI